ncbi:MAG: hydrogenase iron-sulfur subunit [Burkholderiales bacterium]|nr:hydrogenase iron-sulfur subunit [Burkholderiales bacterium]
MAAPTEFKPIVVGFLCNWCCYGGADLAGVSRFQYPPQLRVIRLMCSGRVDLEFIFRAFARKADGVFIGGCHLNDCHYNPEGNYDALGNTLMAKRILEKIGVNPERLRLEWVSAGEGTRFAEVQTELSVKIKSLGPLGSSEGKAIPALQAGLEAATNLVPYIKLVERERLRVPQRTEDGYHKFFGSPEFNHLFEALILDKLAMSRIMGMLRANPVASGEIAASLNLDPEEAARHLHALAQKGMVRMSGSQVQLAVAAPEVERAAVNEVELAQ